jgi:thiosulfate/3-mercaptopyruvate sulfurtransferase
MSEHTAVEPGNLRAVPGYLERLDAVGAANVAETGVLIDVRSPERYRGEDEDIDRVGGHIPGAINVPVTKNRDGDGRFHSAEELLTMFSSEGVGTSKRTGVYCGSGIAAAQEVLALKLAGIDAGLYVGSWSHWVGDPTRPVAAG